jgi:Predicted metal-dependent hydrolase
LAMPLPIWAGLFSAVDISPVAMIVRFSHRGQVYAADLSQPLDLSIPLRDGMENPNCFWAPMPEFAPVRAGDFVGSTQEGGPVNFFNIRLNPHGNGTHTECVGHIARERHVLSECLRQTHWVAKLATVYPQRADNGDRTVTREQMEGVLAVGEADAFILRTMPNDALKLRQNYSGANPPYLHHEAASYLVECGIKHLLLDLPSVDREEDGGLLLAHRAFWQYPQAVRTEATITELVFVPNEVPDGLYLLDIQTTSLDLDASPSKPLVYSMERA